MSGERLQEGLGDGEALRAACECEALRSTSGVARS